MKAYEILSRRALPAETHADGQLPAGETALVKFNNFYVHPGLASEASDPKFTTVTLLLGREGGICTCRITVRGYPLELLLKMAVALDHKRLDHFVVLRSQIEEALQG
jgi:hypothetical protein